VTFRRLPDHELQRLDDEHLIAYIRGAVDAGDLSAGRSGLAILVYGYESLVKRRLAMKMPAHAVEDVASEVIVEAIKGAFDGSSQGEFRAWLNTIIERTRIDWFRRRDRRPQEDKLPSEHSGDEGGWGTEPYVDSEAGAVEVRMVAEEVLHEFNPTHQKVIELYVFLGFSAREVCDKISGMTEDNVAQIGSRYRAALRQRLDPRTER
jgi:RNA polymerase sigma factor (sigma-70 family)